MLEAEVKALAKFDQKSTEEKLVFDNKPYRLLTTSNINQTMLREYICWIGLFTALSSSLQQETFAPLTALAHPSGLNDQFCVTLLNAFDYRTETPRLILKEWLASGSVHIKMEILEIL